MEDNSERPFETVKIGLASAETGVERFTADGFLNLPRVALWRLNLTALSQRYNLYFVASASHVHVYEPDFPFQNLGGTPKLIITPQLANVHAQGYVQPREPHCINHLVTGYLGHQEILLMCTDSGNIVAYYTTSILNAIRRDPLKFSQDAQAEYVGLRPFFSQWVFESAWGLAIHSKGRMIAVSANTPHHVANDDGTSKITVFAFALGEAEQHVRVESDFVELDPSHEILDWVPWTPKSNAGDLGSDIPTRDRNYKIVLAGMNGHTNNTPCVAFVNSSQDPEGSWLLSTDIHCEIKMWRIWRGKCLRTWNFSDRGSPGAAWLRRYEAGWSVAALDINSFRPAESNKTFIGHHRVPQYYGHDAAGASYDITNIVRQHVPSNGIYHPINPDVDDEDTPPELDAIYEDISDGGSTADEAETARVQKVLAELSSTSSVFSESSVADRSTTARPTSPSQTNTAITQFFRNRAIVNGAGELSADSDSDIYVEESEEEVLGVQIESDFSDDEISNTDGDGGSTTSPTSSASTSSAKVHQRTGLQHSSSSSSHKRRLSPYARARIDKMRVTRVQIPDVPFIHCSTSHLRMFRGTETKSPHLFCARILKQILSPLMEGNPVGEMDRLNMIEQIPELGIVIIASQVGRCAVCTLTKRESDGLPGLRVDWILPTRKEERAGIRPVTSSLLGIATGPVQGRFLKESIPLSENDTEENWAEDRVIDGTLTTFDKMIVDLDHRGNQVLGESSEDDSSLDGCSTVENQVMTKAPSPDSRPALTKTHHWPRPKAYEDWMGIDSSRRYRLMMTYADETVLTYELIRGVEREDRDSRVHVMR